MSDTTDFTSSDTQATDAMPGNVDMDLMIDDLSYQDAKEYVLRFLTAEKKLEKLLEERHLTLNTWNERYAYAQQHGTSEQAELAKRELHILIAERDRLVVERDELHRKNIILREKLELKAQEGDTSGISRAEQLLSDFDQIVDVDAYKLDNAVKEQEADDELARLKARLKNS